MPVYGIPECLAALARVGIVGNAGAEIAAKSISEEVANAMRGMVAVDSGELLESIQVVEGGVEVGSDHWVYNEFGTYKMAAQPFIRPAADETDGAEQIEALARVIGALG